MYNEEGDPMERITRKNEAGIKVNNIDEALERLSMFEDFYFDLIRQQEEISRQMKEMQENAQTRQYHYREISAQKVTNNVIINILKRYGIK